MIKENWVILNKKADFNAIGKKYNIDPVTARVIINRNVPEDHIKSYLTCNFSDLYSPELMSGIVEAASILKDKIKSNEKIRIIGDYDVDGVCSTYILKHSIAKCGGIVDTVIPDRVKDGYGINSEMIENAKNDGVGTIITCDNGIAAYSQIELAKSYGICVILTDHHEIPLDENGNEIIPPADIVINPHKKKDSYPFKDICGAVVAFKLVQYALPQILGKDDTNKILSELFEFTALATVCDVMPLVDENRIIVKNALPRMKVSANIGLRALVVASDLIGKELTSFHLGFVIGPCINAAGRLDTADKALALFDESDRDKAIEIASELVKTNNKRKTMTATFEEEACRLVEENKEYNNNVIFIHLSGCHESLAGIIAGRIRERYERPTVVFTDDISGNLKGSGRSTEDFDMFEQFSKCKDLLIKFGGHKAAAGMSVTRDNYEKLRHFFNSKPAENLPQKKITIDVPMPLSYCSLPLAAEFEKLEPFGNGNSKPLFAEAGLKLIGITKIGKNNSAAKMTLLDQNDKSFTAVYFGNLNELNKKLSSGSDNYEIEMLYEGIKNNEIVVDIAYNLGVNSFKGANEAQTVIKYIRRKT